MSQTTQKKPRGFLWRWTRRFLLFLMVFVLVTGLFIAWVTQTGHGRKFLLNQVSSILSTHVFTGTLTAKRIDGPIFGRFILRDVALTDDREQEAATIQTATVRYLFRDLIHRRITIESIDIEGVNVHGRIREDDSFNLGELFIPSDKEDDEPSPLGITIELKRLALQDANVQIVDGRVDELVIALRNSELVADFQMSEQDTMYVGITKLGSDLSFGLAPGAEFAARIDDMFMNMTPETIDFAAGRLTVGDTGLFGFEGTMTRNDPNDKNPKGLFEHIQASIPQLVFSPDEVRAFVPDLPLIVPLKVDASLAGPPDAVLLKAALTGADQDAIAKMTFDTTKGVDASLKALIEIENFHPELWLDFPGLEGDINGEIRVRAQGLTPQRLKADLSIDIDRSTLFGYKLDTGTMRLHYAKDKAELQKMDFRAGSASLQGTGVAGLNGDLQLHIDLNVPDMSALAANAPIQDDLSGSFRTTIDVNGSIDMEHLDGDELQTLDGIMDKIVRQLNISVDAAAKGFKTPMLSMDNLDVSIDGTRGDEVDLALIANGQKLDLGGLIVDSAFLTASVQGSNLDVDGTADLLGMNTAIQATGRWSAKEVALELRQLNVVANDLNVGLAMPATIHAYLSDDGGLDNVAIRELSLGGEGLSLDVPDFQYHNSGSIRGRFSVRVDDLNAMSQYALLEAIQPLELRGSIDASGSIDGTVDKPRYDIHAVTAAFSMMQFGPIDGRIHVQQSAQQMDVNGLLCLTHTKKQTGPSDPNCENGSLLLNADNLVLPIRPGFTSVGPNFYPKGPLDGYAEAGPIDIPRFYGMVDILETWKVRGRVGLKMMAGGNFDQPNVGIWAKIEDVSVTVPGYGSDADAELRDIDAKLTLKIANDVKGLSWIRWGFGEEGITVAGEPWIYARGDAKAPIRDFLLGRGNVNSLLTTTTGDILSLEIPKRSLRDLPAAVLPAELGKDGTVYLAVDVTRTDTFSGAKVTFHGADLKWDTFGPVELYGSALSANDTVLHLDVLDQQQNGLLTLEGNLKRSFGDLVSKGIGPKDELHARATVPELAIEELPDEMLQRNMRAMIDSMKRREQGPTVNGYVDVYGQLQDLRAQGRFVMNNVLTASGDVTEAGLQILFGPSEELGFGGKGQRLQLMGSICGDDNDCALRFHAAAKVDLKSGTFLFGTPGAQEKALENLKSTAYAAQLKADKASIAAMIPPWLFQDLVTGVNGEFSADFHVQGEGLGFPKLRGFLTIDHMQGEIIPLGRKFKDIDLHAVFKKEHFEIQKLHIDDGAGVMDATADFKRVSADAAAGVLELKFHRFLLSDGSGLGAYLTADMPIDIEWDKRGLRLDVPIDNGSVYVPDSVISASSSGPRSLPENVVLVPDDRELRAYVHEATARPEEEETDDTNQLEKVSIPIDVTVRSLSSVYVQQRFADLDVDVDMKLSLRDGQIHTSGGVTIPRGYAQAFGKRFELEQGRVLFDGGGDGPFDPRIRVRAKHRLPRKTAAVLDAPSGDNASVSVVIDSHVSNLDVRLESDPPLSESDVLNVLLTGKPMDTDDGERPEALAAAGTLLAGFLTDQLGENPVLDTLSVELDDSEGGMDSRFEGGRYFGKNKRIYAAVAYIAGADVNENSVEVSWQFILAQLRRSSMRLELRWGDRRSGSMELLYNLRVDRGWRLVRSPQKKDTETKELSP